MDTMRESAKSYLGSGLSVLPIRMDGSKAPMLSEWTPLQQISMTPESWPTCPCGIGIIGGKVSGNLEILDFDKPGAFEEWVAILPMAGDGLAELVDALPVIETPDGGRHVYYRCAEIQGAQKLARAREAYTSPSGKRKLVIIETKGEGGYVVAPPSPAECHDARKPYRQLSGPPLTSIPKISVAQRSWLLQAARSFDEVQAEPVTRPSVSAGVIGDRPGDAFNASATWPSILEPAGWVQLFDRGGVTYWRRPGKDGRGISATTGKCGDHLYVFSSNAPPFDPERSYDKFGAMALLSHGGDVRAAAAALRKLRTQPDPPLSCPPDGWSDPCVESMTWQGGPLIPHVEREPGCDDDVAPVGDPTINRPWLSKPGLSVSTMSDAVNAWASQGESQSIPTPIGSLNEALSGGFPVGQVTTLVAYTGGRKTEFARQSAMHAAVNGHPVIHVDVELGLARIYERTLSQLAKVPPKRLRDRSLRTQADVESIAEVEKRMREDDKIHFICPSGCPKIEDLALVVESLAGRLTNGKPPLVILDSAQRLAFGAPGENPRLQMTALMHAVEAMAHRSGCAIILVSEQKRSQDGKAPSPDDALTSGAESRAIEFVSDVMIALVPEDQVQDLEVKASDAEWEDRIDIMIAKNRLGSRGYLRTAPFLLGLAGG